MEEMVLGKTAVEAAAVAGKGMSLVAMGLAGAGVVVGGYALYKGGQKAMSLYKEREAKKDAALEARIRTVVDSSLDELEKRITENVSKAAAKAAAAEVKAGLEVFFAQQQAAAAVAEPAVAPAVAVSAVAEPAVAVSAVA